MKKNKWMITIAIMAVAGTAVYIYKKAKLRRRLTIVSDAGYETAYDIHFPLKNKARATRRK